VVPLPDRGASNALIPRITSGSSASYREGVPSLRRPWRATSAMLSSSSGPSKITVSTRWINRCRVFLKLYGEKWAVPTRSPPRPFFSTRQIVLSFFSCHGNKIISKSMFIRLITICPTGQTIRKPRRPSDTDIHRTHTEGPVCRPTSP